MKVFLLPLLLFVVSAQEECTTEFNDVVIVGGGMAGISAASRFNDYVLLESTNRIGGRMRSSQFSGYTIEEGANWITGSSVVSDLAEQYGLVTTPHDMYDMIAYDRNGAPIDINVYDESLERFRGALQDATKISEQLFEPNALVLDEGIVKLLRDVGWQPTSQIDQAVQWSSVDWEYAVSDASIRNFEGELPSMRLVVDQRGFEYIAQRFSQDFLDQSRLRLNTRVYKIEYDVLDTTYKARVFARTDSGCIEYQANNVILTVSVGVLNSGLIEFSPPLMYGGSNPFTIAQYVKVYFTFTENFWDDNEFIFTENEVGVCHQWQNLDLEGFLPGSRMLRCEIMTEAFESLLDPSTNELGDETLMSLLEPLRRTYGDLVQPVNSYYTKLHQDEDLGFGAYGFWRIGYGFRDFANFFGGTDLVQYCNHNGCNSRNEWVLHISGSASCYALNESVDGAFSAGRRSADNVLRSRGIEIDSDNPCDQYFADMVPLAEPFIQRNPNPMPSRPTGAPIQDVFQRNPTTSQPRVQPAGPQPSLSPQTEAPTLSPWTPSPTMTDNTPSPTASPLSFPTSLATTSPTTAPQDLPSSRPVPQRPSTEQTSTDQNSSPELSRKRNSPSTPWLILWIAFGFIMTLVLVLLAWLMKIGYGRFCSSRRPQGVVKATTGRHEMRSTNFATEAGSTSSTGSPHFNRSLSFNRDQSNKWINL